MPVTVVPICLPSGQSGHEPSEGTQTQEGQPGAGAAGNVQQPVSTGQGSLGQGGEREQMEQVSAFKHGSCRAGSCLCRRLAGTL